MNLSNHEEITAVLLNIIRNRPGCTRTDIDSELSYHIVEEDYVTIDDIIENLIKTRNVLFTKGRYYPHEITSGTIESVSSGLPGGRIPFAIRTRGHFLWTPERYNLEILRDKLHALKNAYTTIDAEKVPESDSQLRIKFALLDSTKREISYSSGTINADSFFVLTTVGFTRAIPKFLIEAINNHSPDFKQLTDLLPLFSIVYISHHLLEIALQNVDNEAVLAIDGFSIVQIPRE